MRHEIHISEQNRHCSYPYESQSIVQDTRQSKKMITQIMTCNHDKSDGKQSKVLTYTTRGGQYTVTNFNRLKVIDRPPNIWSHWVI